MNEALKKELRKELEHLEIRYKALNDQKYLIGKQIEGAKLLLGSSAPAPEPEPEAPAAPRPSELPPPADSPAAKPDVSELGPKDPYYLGRTPAADENSRSGVPAATKQALEGFPNGTSPAKLADAIEKDFPHVNRKALLNRVTVALHRFANQKNGVKKIGRGRYALDNGAAA